MEDTKLKPCPFCGRYPFTISTECKQTGYKGFYIYHECERIESFKTHQHDTEQEAIDAWNRRRQ